jgi:hypothetical protein
MTTLKEEIKSFGSFLMLFTFLSVSAVILVKLLELLIMTIKLSAAMFVGYMQLIEQYFF